MPYLQINGVDKIGGDLTADFTYDFQINEFPVAMQIFQMIVGNPATMDAEIILVGPARNLMLVNKKAVDAFSAAQKAANLQRGNGIVGPKF